MKYTLSVEKVESDDFGDKQWQYHVVFKEDQSELWSDYFRQEPCLEELLEWALELDCVRMP